MYLRDLYKYLHPNVHLLQYADDNVIVATHKNVNIALNYIKLSLIRVHKFLINKGLELSPQKSKCVVFSKVKYPPDLGSFLVFNQFRIPIVSQVKFLGVLFDS